MLFHARFTVRFMAFQGAGKNIFFCWGGNKMRLPEAIREQVRPRAGFACESCGVTETDALRWA